MNKTNATRAAVVLGLNEQEQAWLESLGATFQKANDSGLPKQAQEGASK